MKPGNNLKESVLNFPFEVQYFNRSQGLRNTKLNITRARVGDAMGHIQARHQKGTMSADICF